MTDADEQEWITTVEASQLLGCSYEKTRTVLKRFDCTRQESHGRATMWRRADVLAAKELAPGLVIVRPREKPKLAPTNLRPCLCCSVPFPSDGIHNRLCDLCRRGDGTEHSIAGRRK